MAVYRLCAIDGGCHHFRLYPLCLAVVRAEELSFAVWRANIDGKRLQCEQVHPQQAVCIQISSRSRSLTYASAECAGSAKREAVQAASNSSLNETLILG